MSAATVNGLSTNNPQSPSCIRSSFDLLSEGDAQRQGLTAWVVKLPMSAVLRAQTTDERQGFMKALVSASDDRILGFTMIGAEAGEVLATVQTAMRAGRPYSKLRDAVLTHPTMVEGPDPLFSNVPPRTVEKGESASP